METVFKVAEELQDADDGSEFTVYQVLSTYTSASGKEHSVFIAECDDPIWANKIADMLNGGQS